MNATSGARRPLIVVFSLTAVLTLALTASSAGTRTRSGSMLVNARLGAACGLVAECTAFTEVRCHPTAGPAIDPRPGHDAADSTPASGSWEDGVEASVLNVGGWPSTTLAYSSATARVSRSEGGGVPNLGYAFLDSQCQTLVPDSPSVPFTYGTPFTVKVPKRTKWVIGFVAGARAEDISWSLSFPCGVTNYPAC